MRKFAPAVAAIAALLLLNTCGSYKQVSVGKNDFYNDNRIPRKISSYDVYVHDGPNLYRLAKSDFPNDTLRGTLEPIDAGSVNAHPEGRSELKAAKDDLHIYLSQKANTLVISARDTTSVVKHVAIPRTAVERVDMFAKNERSGFQLFGYIFALAAIGALIVYALILALVKASGEAADESSGGSNSDSGGSDSGSGDSGGSNSDSGGSDSGGSDSGGASGCYVATMVYGSYDAPNVLVLRAFRDRFLQRSAPGRAFIGWYYKNSPRFVTKHQDKVLLGRIIRTLLNAFVWLIRPVFGR